MESLESALAQGIAVLTAEVRNRVGAVRVADSAKRGALGVASMVVAFFVVAKDYSVQLATASRTNPGIAATLSVFLFAIQSIAFGAGFLEPSERTASRQLLDTLPVKESVLAFGRVAARAFLSIPAFGVLIFPVAFALEFRAGARGALGVVGWFVAGLASSALGYWLASLLQRLPSAIGRRISPSSLQLAVLPVACGLVLLLLREREGIPTPAPILFAGRLLPQGVALDVITGQVVNLPRALGALGIVLALVALGVRGGDSAGRHAAEKGSPLVFRVTSRVWSTSWSPIITKELVLLFRSSRRVRRALVVPFCLALPTVFSAGAMAAMGKLPPVGWWYLVSMNALAAGGLSAIEGTCVAAREEAMQGELLTLLPVDPREIVLGRATVWMALGPLVALPFALVGLLGAPSPTRAGALLGLVLASTVLVAAIATRLSGRLDLVRVRIISYACLFMLMVSAAFPSAAVLVIAGGFLWSRKIKLEPR